MATHFLKKKSRKERFTHIASHKRREHVQSSILKEGYTSGVITFTNVSI